MTTLYVLGNGFDLAHGMPTKWINFGESDPGRTLPWDLFIDPYDPKAYDTLWADVESAVGHPRIDYVRDEASSIYNGTLADFNSDSNPLPTPDEMSLESSVPILNRISEFEESLLEWIGNVTLAEPRFTKWHAEDSLFVNFNYTLMLEKKYGVPPDRVCHVHGSTADEEILFGHGADDAAAVGYDSERKPHGPEVASLGNPDLFADDEEDQLDSATSIATEELMEALEKNTDEGEERLEEFLSQADAASVSQIVVMGQSFGSVDAGYFRMLAEEFPGRSWTIFYFIPPAVDAAARLADVRRSFENLRTGIDQVDYRPSSEFLAQYLS